MVLTHSQSSPHPILVTIAFGSVERVLRQGDWQFQDADGADKEKDSVWKPSWSICECALLNLR